MNEHIWHFPDIVNSVLSLIEGSDFITGHTLLVDGGQLIAADCGSVMDIVANACYTPRHWQNLEADGEE